MKIKFQRSCSFLPVLGARALETRRTQSCPVSTGRMDPRVGSGHDFAGYWRVGSGQQFGFFSFLLIISWYLNRYESSNTTLGLMDFHRYLIYDNYLINK